MSFTNSKINISIDNKTYEIYYSYNEKTCFQNLLEYFTFLIPSLNICKCYRFHIFENKNNDFSKAILISESSKIVQFSDYLKNLVLIKNKVNCEHKKQNLLLYSKNDIISCLEKNEKESRVDKKRYEELVNNNILIPKPKDKKYNSIDFYDVIINIESIKDINKGWDIKMSQIGKKIMIITKKKKY